MSIGLRRQRGALALLATKGRFISPRGACFSTINFSFPEELLSKAKSTSANCFSLTASDLKVLRSLRETKPAMNSFVNSVNFV